MGKINQKQNGNGVTRGSGRSYLCLEERIEKKRKEKKRGATREKGKRRKKKGEKRKLSIFPKFWPLVSARRGLVDVDSVDELCEELLHLPGTRVQCGTSDMEREHELDVTAGGEEHGQTLTFLLPHKHEVSTFFISLEKYIFKHI